MMAASASDQVTGSVQSDNQGVDRGGHDDPRVRVTRLDNGLTIVSEAMPGLKTAALGVWVNAGSRHETVAEAGGAHFLEHMAFKGTTTRSARDIVEELEAVGADLNAATSVETTAYYVRLLKDDIARGVDVISDIVLNPVFDPDELAREREVIVQEIAGLQDSPDEVVYDLAQDAAFTDQAIGRPIAGTIESVRGLDAAALSGFRARLYHPDRMIVSAAGAVDHDQLVAFTAKAFAARPANGLGDAETAPTFVGGVRASDRPFEQAHLVLGVDAPSFRAPEFFASQVFSGLLGGGMSSRLFQTVREERGLCYSIYASTWGLCDGGFLTIHAATGAEQLDELGAVVIDELDSLAAGDIGDDEISRAKAQLKAGLMMSLESPGARAEQMARQLMVYGRTLDADTLLARVALVSRDDVAAIARSARGAGNPVVAVVGAGDRSAAHAEAVAQRWAR